MKKILQDVGFYTYLIFGLFIIGWGIYIVDAPDAYFDKPLYTKIGELYAKKN